MQLVAILSSILAMWDQEGINEGTIEIGDEPWETDRNGLEEAISRLNSIPPAA